ncbi:TatD family hydrolase [bacterium]|nr:TatD family hydrolase [bacterium]
MATFIDTHLHLTWPTLREDIPEVVRRAREAGVGAMVDLGTSLSTSLNAQKHAHQFEGVYFAAGIHPNDAAEAEEGDLERIAELVKDDKCVAVGEIGLDYYRDYAAPEVQKNLFRAQLALAREVGKPVVIHDREASEDILRVLEEEGYDGHSSPGGVFHCFAGDVAMVEEVVKRGFYLSFTGNVTFKKTDRLEPLAAAPLDRLMIETDSPFMAPVPHRGKRNEPAFVPYVAATIARVKELPLEEVARATTANAIRFFNLNGINFEDRD